MLDEDETRKHAELDVKLISDGESSILIDEWYLVPKIWDSVRRECDKTQQTGNYILTGSTTLPSKSQKENVHHSGAGRIARMKMYPMSLYESGDSVGKASLQDMLNGVQKNCSTGDIEVRTLADLIIRGGWPANLNKDVEDYGVIPKAYIEAVLNEDINSAEDKKV